MLLNLFWNFCRWCGKFSADGDGNDVHFMTVNKDDYNPHLIRFYMEHVWKLKRPDVIISVTGGAQDFDLSTEDLDKIFKGMMDGTRSLNSWFVTGGTRTGVMKYVGTFRQKYNPAAPLIGITPFGAILGSEHLRGIDIGKCGTVDTKIDKEKGWKTFGFDTECLPVIDVTKGSDEHLQQKVKEINERLVQGQLFCSKSTSGKILEHGQAYLKKELSKAEKAVEDKEKLWQKFEEFKTRCAVDPGQEQESVEVTGFKAKDFEEICQKSWKQREHLKLGGAALDPNHSHFIFADNGSLGDQAFGIEVSLRADVESCAAGNFKGVGVKQTGAGGKILQKIDDQIINMLTNPKEKGGESYGWMNTNLPLVPAVADKTAFGLKWETMGASGPATGIEIKNKKLAAALKNKFVLTKAEFDNLQVSSLSPDSYIKAGDSYLKPVTSEDKSLKVERRVVQCEEAKCRRFMWAPPEHRDHESEPFCIVCELCTRNGKMKEKLEEQRMKGQEDVTPRHKDHKEVQVAWLKHAMSNEEKISWDPKDISRHEQHLKHLKSTEYLDEHPPPDPCDTYQKTNHHQLYIRLLNLLDSGADFFEVTYDYTDVLVFQCKAMRNHDERWGAGVETHFQEIS